MLTPDINDSLNKCLVSETRKQINIFDRSPTHHNDNYRENSSERCKRKIRKENLRKSLSEAKQIPFDIRRMTSINFRAIFYMLSVLNLSAFLSDLTKKNNQKAVEKRPEMEWKKFFARNEKNVNGNFLSFSRWR